MWSPSLCHSTVRSTSHTDEPATDRGVGNTNRGAGSTDRGVGNTDRGMPKCPPIFDAEVAGEDLVTPQLIAY